MSHRIRLMQITHDLAIGGLQRVVATICRTIDRDAFDVHVLCLRALGPFTGDIEQLGVPVTLLPQTGRTDYLSFLKVASILRRQRIDVIHTHNTQPLIDGTLGALLAGVRTIVHTDHGRVFPDKRRYMLAERLSSRFAYRIVGVSDATSANLAEYERIPRAKLQTIPNGIDASVYDVPIDRTAERRRLGLDDHALVVGLAARLTAVKGIGCLLNALPTVVSRFPSLVLLIAGEGPVSGDLQADADRLGVARHVKFLGPRADIPVLLRVFDVYALPSLSEGLPMVLLEAMAAGCPIVATSVGGVPSAITSEANGLLVRPGDPAALADALCRLLGDGQLRQRLAEEAKRVFRARYSAETMMRQYEKLYRREA